MRQRPAFRKLLARIADVQNALSFSARSSAQPAAALRDAQPALLCRFLTGAAPAESLTDDECRPLLAASQPGFYYQMENAGG